MTYVFTSIELIYSAEKNTVCIENFFLGVAEVFFVVNLLFLIFFYRRLTLSNETHRWKTAVEGRVFFWYFAGKLPFTFNFQIRLLPEIIRFWEPQPYFPSRGQWSYGLVEFVSRTCLWRLVKNLPRGSEFSEFPCNSVHFSDNFLPSFPNLG